MKQHNSSFQNRNVTSKDYNLIAKLLLNPDILTLTFTFDICMRVIKKQISSIKFRNTVRVQFTLLLNYHEQANKTDN